MFALVLPERRRPEGFRRWVRRRALLYAAFGKHLVHHLVAPREFELEGDEAVLRKEGDRLIIEPVRKGRLLALLASLEPLEEKFPDVDEDLAHLDEVEL